jgi:myo-inositol-1(or 4)-monophosphatase
MKIADFATQTAQKAGKYILKKSKKPFKVNMKGKKDIVTEVDIAVEKLIIKEIKRAYPDHAIIAEEDSFANKTNMEEVLKAPYIWFIDPIDGTTNYAQGLPFYAVSIGVFKTSTSGGELVAGTIYAPKIDRLYTAEKGKGARLNGKKIAVSKTKKIANSVMATGFKGSKTKNISYFKKMMEETRALRRFGAASLDLAFTASGEFDGFWEFGLYPWDVAAGALIVKEAGGKVTDTSGNLLDLFGKDIFVSNGKIHKETLNIFKAL